MTASRGRGRFATTQWTLVLAAARDEDRDGRRAMESVCERYWYPLYVFVGRRGYTPEDAQDLEYEGSGKSALFARLADLITGADANDSHRDAAADLGMTEGAVKVAVHRMRRRFRDVLRGQIAEMVDADALDDEIAFLIRAVGRRSTEP